MTGKICEAKIEGVPCDCEQCQADAFEEAMRGRLAARPGFMTKEWRGLGTREGRLYLLYSLACQANPDQERALRLLRRHYPEHLAKAKEAWA